MASSSIDTFSLIKPQSQLLNPKTQKKTIHNTLELSNQIHKQKPLSLYSTLQPISQFHISPKHFILCPYSSQLPVLRKPTSDVSPLKRFSTFCTEKIVIFLIGSFLFMGFLGTRPVVAIQAEKSSYSEKIDEERETQNGKSDDEEMYVKLLQGNPRNVEALKMVFHEKMRRGKTEEALEYVKRLINIQPVEVEWQLLEALCYEMIGELSTATTLFKSILARRPLLVRALHGLAMVMHKNHEGPAIFEMLNKAMEVAHHEKRVTEERSIGILIAQIHVVKGELEEGLKKFQVLVDENPRDFRPYLCQGIIYSLLEKKDKAEEQFEIYRSLVPEEFPQRGFLDDVVLEAKTSSKQQLEKDIQS